MPDGTIGNPIYITEVEGKYNFIQSVEDSTYKYYGFVSSLGWKIKRKTLIDGTWKISKGDDDYSIAWADRANKIYNYY